MKNPIVAGSSPVSFHNAKTRPPNRENGLSPGPHSGNQGPTKPARLPRIDRRLHGGVSAPSLPARQTVGRSSSSETEMGEPPHPKKGSHAEIPRVSPMRLSRVEEPGRRGRKPRDNPAQVPALSGVLLNLIDPFPKIISPVARSKKPRRVPWKHEKAGASPAAATISIKTKSKSQAGKSRPGAHNPGRPEHYRGLPPISRCCSCQRTVNPPSQNKAGSRRVEHYHQHLPSFLPPW